MQPFTILSIKNNLKREVIQHRNKLNQGGKRPLHWKEKCFKTLRGETEEETRTKTSVVIV